MTTSNHHYDVIVAGIGSMGASACCHLAERGVSVLGLEQFDIPNTRGSHHGHTRMIRQSYFEHCDYVPLLQRAYELWENLHANSEKKIFLETGGLYLGPPGSEIVKGAIKAAQIHDLPHELLDHAELKERFPQIRLPESFDGFFEDRAGLLIPENAISACAAQAVANGAEIRSGEAIVEWESSKSGVTVKTAAGGIFSGGHLVFTAGAWTGRLIRELGVELSVTRQVLAWFEPREPAAFTPDQFPCWFIETDSPFGHYGFPITGSQPGFKIALHKPGDPIEPGDPDLRAEASAEEINALRMIVAEFFPAAEGPLQTSCTCLYTNSADGHFIIDRHPDFENVSLACGFSGHGFKFASVVGEILADLALNGRTDLPAGFLGLQRFD